MELQRCALCQIVIDSKIDSKEHIIPNAIGGRKKVKGFICKSCNNISGNSWDSELAKQLNPLSLFFGIKRERKNPPSQLFETDAGYKMGLNSDGSMYHEKPTYVESLLKDSEKVQISIKARTVEEAKNLLNRAKSSYPNIDVKDALGNLEFKSSYCTDMLKLDMSFGGHNAGRSVVKSALALAFSSGVSLESCNLAIKYLKHEKSEACFGYFYEYDVIKNRPKGVPLHCVSIKACNKTNQVLAYVEYFGIYRMVLHLGDCYDGQVVSNTYSINPMTGEELTLVTELNLTMHDIQEAYNYNKIPEGSVIEAANPVIAKGMKASYDREKKRVIEKAIKHAFQNCGAKEGEMLMPEHINKIQDLVWKELEPFLLSRIRQLRK